MLLPIPGQKQEAWMVLPPFCKWSKSSIGTVGEFQIPQLLDPSITWLLQNPQTSSSYLNLWPSPLPSSLLSSMGYDGFFYNNSHSSTSIWCFLKSNSKLGITLIDFSTQYLTISFINPSNATKCLLTGIYASSNYIQRRDLWGYLSSQANTNCPWCALGDFNAITFASEKYSLRPSRFNLDFQQLALLKLAWHGLLRQ